MAEQAGIALPLARKAMTLLCDQGRAWCASSDFYFEMPAIEGCKQAIIDHFAADGEGTVAALRDALGVSRKYVVPLLESFDKAGFTRRYSDNLRCLR